MHSLQQLLTSQREEVALLATDVSKIGDRVNAVELASIQLAARVQTTEVSIEELRSTLQNQESEMKVCAPQSF